MNDKELEKIRKKKLEELKKKQESEEEQEEKVSQAKAQIERALRKVLTPKAWDKWNNVKFANEQNAYAAAQAILRAVQAGQLEIKVSEEDLRGILSKINNMTRKEFNIKRR